MEYSKELLLKRICRLKGQSCFGFEYYIIKICSFINIRSVSYFIVSLLTTSLGFENTRQINSFISDRTNNDIVGLD